jgi:serine/threonine protein kinase
MTSQSDLVEIATKIARQYGFDLVRQLGQGAFKTAFLASKGQQQFAFKVARLTGSTERLFRETVALRGCDHPGVAKLYEAFPAEAHGAQWWVVIEELLAGGTLLDQMDGPLDPDRTRRIGLAIAKVLEHLHERRLVHRDIKPANIMFRTSDDQPVLTDFGIVRMLDKPTLTHAFVPMGPGTPMYAAPEQLLNDKSLIDWRTDQFGLAIVLGECLTGRHPFARHGQTAQDAISAVAARHDLPTESAEELNRLGFSGLVRALSPWPVNRFRKPQDFVLSFS